MKFGPLLIAGAVVIVPDAVVAKIVDLSFAASGRFEHAESVGPGKFVEICAKLDRGDRVAWSFQAADPLDFNIHYHVGDKVEYPERQSGIRSREGAFEAPLPQHFCWMWRNTGKSEVMLRTVFRKG